MKIGSIVVIKKVKVHPLTAPHVEWLPIMDKRTPYTVREIKMSNRGNMMAFFEEGVIGIVPTGEIGIPLDHLIEILPPEDISEEMNNIIQEYQTMEV